MIFDCLKSSGVVHVAASEENPIEIDCGYQSDRTRALSSTDISNTGSSDGVSKGFSVAFDPLDGSSIVDANFAVGTIAGIWPGKGLLNRRGKEQVTSIEQNNLISAVLNTVSFRLDCMNRISIPFTI